MNLTILGCGTIVQETTSKNCSGYLLDQKFLLDCGPGIWKALNQYDISKEHISHIFLSHFHLDHTSDLGPILLNRFLHTNLKNTPLRIIGPPGLIHWFSDLKKLLGKWSEDLSIQLDEINDRPYRIGKYTFISRLTGHSESSNCYRVETEESSFFYSGDTGFNENIIDLARKCHLAVIEASNSDKTHIEEHLTPGLAGKFAATAGVEKLVLTHMYPEVLAGDPVKEAAAEFSGEIIIAQEGMSLEF
jgi:ribonuclease BN (tRNA processing enzyme)